MKVARGYAPSCRQRPKTLPAPTHGFCNTFPNMKTGITLVAVLCKYNDLMHGKERERERAEKMSAKKALKWLLLSKSIPNSFKFNNREHDVDTHLCQFFPSFLWFVPDSIHTIMEIQQCDDIETIFLFEGWRRIGSRFVFNNDLYRPKSYA